MEGFALQRGRKLRDELLLHTAERLPGGIVARGGGDAVNAVGKRLDARVVSASPIIAYMVQPTLGYTM